MGKGELQRQVGRNLLRIRKQRGVSQMRFAEEFLRLHRVYYGAIERGEQNLSLGAVEDYAERLGVAPMELLREPEDE